LVEETLKTRTNENGRKWNVFLFSREFNKYFFYCHLHMFETHVDGKPLLKVFGFGAFTSVKLL
jgi:hypothetical protein